MDRERGAWSPGRYLSRDDFLCPHPPLPNPRAFERGATLVETALVLVLLMMLLVGIVTAGVSLGRSNALQTAAREGARFGATLPVSDTEAWLASVLDVSKAAAIGDLNGGVDGQYLCAALFDGTSWSRLTESGGARSGTVDAQSCFSDGRPADEPRVQVKVGRNTEIQVVVFSATISLTGKSTARFERAG